MKVFLASASPRRRDILRNLGFEVMVCPAHVDESPFLGESPIEHVLRLAKDKVSSLDTVPLGTIGLGADTVVTLGNSILGKPSTQDEAIDMLRRLSGQWHRVVTGLALRTSDHFYESYAVTDVFFSPMSETEISWYVSTREPMDKAGAYGIQGFASLFIREVHGSASNVIGLPVHVLYSLIKEAGLQEAYFRRPPEQGA